MSHGFSTYKIKLLSKAALILNVIVLLPVFVAAQVTVGHDGKSDFSTIQAAIDAVPDNSTKQVTIRIKPGIYKEKITIRASKTRLNLVGADSASTIITYDDYASKAGADGKNIGTSGSASFRVEAADFTASNLTFVNSSGPVGQAVAALVGGTRAHFTKCRFVGFQDTLYTYGAGNLQLFENCKIEGSVDFIFGPATVWFENCQLFCKNGGYVTAASTPDSLKFGYVFYKCRLEGDAGNDSFSLGRPWRPFARTVYIRSYLSAIIRSEGWSIWTNKDNLQTTFYAEFENTGPGFTPGKRASWTRQLTPEEMKKYTRLNVLSGWKPSNQN